MFSKLACNENNNRTVEFFLEILALYLVTIAEYEQEILFTLLEERYIGPDCLE